MNVECVAGPTILAAKRKLYGFTYSMLIYKYPYSYFSHTHIGTCQRMILHFTAMALLDVKLQTALPNALWRISSLLRWQEVVLRVQVMSLWEYTASPPDVDAARLGLHRALTTPKPKSLT